MQIVLAYSGGLDTSVLLKQYIEAGHDVVAMTLNLGESDMVAGDGSQAALDAVRKKALDLGAKDAVLIDARERFIHDYAYKALAANARYQGTYPLSAALSRPLIADLLWSKSPSSTATDAVAHGCTGKGNDQVRIEVGVRARAPQLTRARAAAREAALAARRHRVRANSTTCRSRTPLAKPYSVDANLWGRSIEAGVLEDPWNAPPEDAYAWTVDPADAPAAGTEIVLAFERGMPVDGRRARRGAAVFELNKLAGANGVGRIDMIEDRVVGLKSREVYECPGSVTLIEAHIALERLVLTKEELRLKAQLDQRYGELIYDGQWSSPLRARARRVQREDRANG